MLTDTKIRKTKPEAKAQKLFDSGGLFIFVSKTGAKLWRWKYRYAGKEKLLSFGQYPEVSLAEARGKRDEAKAVLAQGRDPSAAKALSADGDQAASTFEQVAREWHEVARPGWTPTHSNDVLSSLEKEVFPFIGDVSLDAITAPDVLAVLRKIEKRGANETARRIRQRISSVFAFAIASGRAQMDPAAMVTKAMAPLKRGRQPAITDLEETYEMLRRTEQTPSHPVSRFAIRLIALTAVRPGTLATTPWSEWTDDALDEGLWQIPAERMKLLLKHKDDEARDHIVPLSKQAVETIRVLRRLSGRQPFAFPNTRHSHKAMSENAMGYLLNRAGYHHRHCPHGFRSTFSTIMNELYPQDRKIIDLMLAHVPKDKVEAAYNRAQHLSRRIELAQIWADIVMKGAPSAEELLTSAPRKILKRSPIDILAG